MNNLHDVGSSMKLESPSFWFWVKAGAGIAMGFFAFAIPLWFFVTFGALAFVGALLGVRPH